MKVATSHILNDIDRACVEKLKLPVEILMENAALKLLKHMEIEKYERYVIVCGCGNNGGDGFALARHLMVVGKSVSVFLISSEKAVLSSCAEMNYNILQNMGLKITRIRNLEEVYELSEAVANAEVTVDGIFGTGISRKVEGIFEAVIAVINENSKRIFSIDIPSGINSDTGKIMGSCIRAHKTISFQLYKRGFLNYDCGKYLGKVIVENIGIPEFIVDQYHEKEFITEAEFIREYIKKREKYSFKGDFGRVSVIAGSMGFTGAAYISSEAAVKSGSGLVTAISSSKVQEILSSKLVEAMTSTYEKEDTFIKLVGNSDAVAFGPGMGNTEHTFELLCRVMEMVQCPVVLDADGINVMNGHTDKFKQWQKKVVITPHLGEMARLTGYSIDHIRGNRLDVAKNFAKEYNIVVLLKGYETIITDGSILYVNPTGSSAMASGGMGDCLTGIIAAFIAQGISPFEAAVCGAYIHGYTGDKLSKELYSVNASDIIRSLPEVIKEFISI
jgi:ADP-dependent NAD(P)H-hydrate dehydratase / NAD(P)H-hydrate epimerase